MIERIFPFPALARSLLRPLSLTIHALAAWRDNARAKRDCAAMLSMSDDVLHDIGLSRTDILDALEQDRRHRWRRK